MAPDQPRARHATTRAVGRHENACAATSALLGGHVRVGVESDLLNPDGTTAPDQAAPAAASATRVASGGRPADAARRRSDRAQAKASDVPPGGRRAPSALVRVVGAACRPLARPADRGRADRVVDRDDGDRECRWHRPGRLGGGSGERHEEGLAIGTSPRSPPSSGAGRRLLRPSGSPSSDQSQDHPP
nr:3-keto-5-aminohexanoate cleavage protein [Methylobacterium nonmethylotrophicum]